MTSGGNKSGFGRENALLWQISVSFFDNFFGNWPCLSIPSYFFTHKGRSDMVFSVLMPNFLGLRHKVHFHFEVLQCLKLLSWIASHAVMESDERTESLLTAEAKATCEPEVLALCTGRGRVYNPQWVTYCSLKSGWSTEQVPLALLFCWPLMSINSQSVWSYPWPYATQCKSANL